MEARFESGSIFAELRSTSLPMRATPFSLRLSIPFIESAAWALPAPDEDEAAYEAGITVVAEQTRATLLAGFNDPATQASLAALRPFGLTAHVDVEPAEDLSLSI
jgi:hypothetical protein